MHTLRTSPLRQPHPTSPLLQTPIRFYSYPYRTNCSYPWDLTRSVAGSSGGPAAAVAAGMVAVAHGSDGTGSLRYPAALCGVATLNPTAGRIPSVPPAGQPANPVWRDFVLARHACDLAFVFESLTGARTGPSVPPLRVGFLDHDPELGLGVDPACREAVQVACRLLETLGHQIEESWPAQLDHLWAQAQTALGVVSDAVRPPVLAWVDDRLGRRAERGELDDSFFDAVERCQHREPDQVAAAGATVEAAMNPILDWWDHHDLLVTPTTFQPAWPLGTAPGPGAGTLLAPFSFTRQPSLSLPLHHTDDGLPVGVQLVGRLGEDEVLLALAGILQDSSDWTRRRPPVA